VSLADNSAAVAAAVTAYAKTKPNLTMMDVRQRPGEGNYDRIEEVSMAAALRAAEAVGVDKQDTLVLEDIGEDEGENNATAK
jgi:hypothetical protein